MLNKLPLISIVIPVFNVTNYIEECLKSVVAQTYKNIEILCIDDCGTDNSMEIVNKYAAMDARIKVLTHNKNKGVAPARNFGITTAKGDFIFFLDSDDYIHPTAIQELVTHALTSQADIILCGSKTFVDQKYDCPDFDECITKLDKFLNSDFDSLQVTEHNFYSSLRRVSCVAWGKLFKTKFINDYNLRFIDENAIYEDNGFHAKFLACSPYISCLHKHLYFYRIRQNSITQNANNKTNKSIYLKISIEDAISFISNSGNPLLKYELQDFYYSLFMYKNSFMKFYWGEKRKLLKIFGISFINYSYKFNNIKKLSILGIRIS